MKQEGMTLHTPISQKVIQKLRAGDLISIKGPLYTGRDAALPRLVKLLKKGDSPLRLEGAVFMHTAVSPAGISPTTSKKMEYDLKILSSLAHLSLIGYCQK